MKQGSVKRLTLAVSLLLSFFIFGCATYQSKTAHAKSSLINGKYTEAIDDLKPLAYKEDGDQLVYLLDYATTLQIAGNYQESISAFLKADRLADMADYHSLGRQAGSLLLNQEMVQYKGDTFEKIFINAYLAMNYLQRGLVDDALVEARRINEKYIRYRQEEKKDFELNSFSKYLSALIWESSKNYDDAYIAYAEAFEIDPSLSNLKSDLIRTAKLAKRYDAYKEWRRKFPEIIEDKNWNDKSLGELILIYQQGWGPKKIPAPGEYRLPTLMPVESETKSARLIINNQDSVSTSLIYNVQDAAIKTLQDDYDSLIAKRMAGIAAKAVASDQIRQKNQLLGDLTYIALTISDRADLRQWSTLPQSIQIARISLPPGRYKYQIEGINNVGVISQEAKSEDQIEIKAGQKKFIIWRSVK